MPVVPGSQTLWKRLVPYYQVGEVLGTGATGLVVSAIRRGDGREVAIKTLQPSLAHDLDLVHSLEREATAGRTIRHPGVVPVLDQGWLSNGAPYVTFPLLRGESLLSLLGRHQRLEAREAAWIVERVARVLGAVHGAGYVHRDIKPEHVLLAPERERLRVYLIDFGVCQAPDQDGTPLNSERGRVFGTPGYLAPEQAKGEAADGRSDLYGLGCVLFEMLAGRPPFPGKNPARVMYRSLCEEPPRLEPASGLPAPLCQLSHRLLAREPSVRPENARTVARMLAPLLGDELEVEQLIARKVRGSAAPTGTTPTRRLGLPSLDRILAADG
jgi:serine/threonine protein kinase